MRFLGWLATVLGIVGVIGCLVVAVGVWAVRSPVSDKTHEIAAIASEGLAKAHDLADKAATRLTTTSENLGTLSAALTTAAGSPLVDTAVGTKIRDLVSGFVEGPYADLHESVTGLRERLTSISDVVQRLDAAIPGIELPGVVTTTIDDVDARLTQLDSTVSSVNQIAGNGITTGEQLTSLSDQVTQIQGVVDTIVPALGTAQTQIAEAQTKIDHVTERVDGWLTWGALGTTIVFIYLALLNVLLYQQGRRWVAAASAPKPATTSGG